MGNFPLVSATVPVHDTPDELLHVCVRSIVEQTYTSWEAFLVDDGSKEETARLCDELADLSDRIIVEHQEPLGVSVARNRGLELARGVYIVFVDSDDALAPDALAAMVKACVEDALDVVVCDYSVTQGERSWEETFFNGRVGPGVISDVMKRELATSCLVNTGISAKRGSTNVGVPWAKMYSRAFLDDNRLQFVPGLKRMQDTIFNLRALWLAQRVGYLPSDVYRYRRHAGSATKMYSPDFGDTALRLVEEFEAFEREYSAAWLHPSISAKRFALFCEWCELAVAHPDSHLPRREQVRMIREMTQSSTLLADMSDCDVNALGRRDKIAHALWLRSRWRCLQALLSWTYELKKTRAKLKGLFACRGDCAVERRKHRW